MLKQFCRMFGYFKPVGSPSQAPLYKSHQSPLYILSTPCKRLSSSFRSQGLTSSMNGGYKHNHRRNYQTLSLSAVTAYIAFSLPWSKKSEEDELPKDPVVLALKQGVLASQKGNFQEAQEFFHKGLELGNEQKKNNTIDEKQHLVMLINIYGLMATTAVRSGDFTNAEKLYKESMKCCMTAGRSSTDESVVELSIKLASLYAMLSRDDEAEQGFQFCIKSMEEKVKIVGGILEADTNTLALQGLAIQSYARFLMKKKQHTKAVELYKQSLDIAREVYGADHPQALVVLNDLASAYVISQRYKEGIKTYQECIARAEKREDMADSLVAFYYNLGEACILNKDFVQAQQHCNSCLEVAKKIGNSTLIQAAQQCIRDVKEVKAKENK